MGQYSYKTFKAKRSYKNGNPLTEQEISDIFEYIDMLESAIGAMPCSQDDFIGDPYEPNEEWDY